MTVVLFGAILGGVSCDQPSSSDSLDQPESTSTVAVGPDVAEPLRGEPAITSVTGTLEFRLGSPTTHADPTNSAPINDVAVDGAQRVATAASDGIVMLYEPSGSSPTSVPLLHPEGHVDGVAFDPRGDRLATGVAQRRDETAFDDTVSVWDFAGAERLIDVGGDADAVVGCAFFRNIVEWAHDGSFLTSTSHDFTVSMIDPSTGETLHTFSPQGNSVLDTAISPDDRLLITSADDSTLRVWDLQSKDLIADHQVTMGGYWSIAFLPDGTSLVVGDLAGNVSVVDVLSGETKRTFAGEKTRHASIAVSPDGRLVAAGADDSVVRLWSTDSGEVVGDLVGHDGPVNSVAFSDDGKHLVSGSSDGTAIVWRYAST